MPPAAKTLAALAAAVAMVVGAVFVRDALDTKKVRDDLRLTVACDPLAEDFCRAAVAADPRITMRYESPDVTSKALAGLAQGAAPDVQAWVSVGPWLQMADGKRPGQASLQKDVAYVAATPIVLVTRQGQKLDGCGKPAPACLPLPNSQVGLPSPKTSGIGLAALAQVVMAASATPASGLDRTFIESGPPADVIDRLARVTNTRADLTELSTNFSRANPVITTQAAAAPAAPRAAIINGTPPVQAVLQVGILDSRAEGPLTSEPAGEALAKAATAAGWGPPGDPSGGLPEPGVLAALQDAWSGP